MNKNVAIDRLVTAINEIIGKARVENTEICREIGIKDDGICNDVLVKPRHEGCDVWLAYDGDGFDSFSLYSDVPYLMRDAGIDVPADWEPPLRKKVLAIARHLGFHSEDQNSWSLGFYFNG